MNRLTAWVADRWTGRVPTGEKRNPMWRRVREAHLEVRPLCENCGGSKDVEVHHIKPFHLFPELELDPDNLITLCTSRKGGVNCHLYMGHLGSWQSWNESVARDAPTWRGKLERRP